MRPHRVRLRAFGPFAGEVEVDLDALAAGGLFLLHGETGSGKTTLLDAIGFALYGRVPGVRGRTGRLRSDHADPAVRTEVELEVTIAGRRWRITRSPAQERPKSRGTGTTTEQARIHLQELRTGEWASVSTRIDEAAAELDPLLGMSADQFFQVVLLPQGEFAQFLRADSGKRGELLQRLFATERFKDVEDWLVARRVATSATVAAARQELAVLVARLAQAAGVPAPDGPDPGWGPALLDAAAAACDGARSRAAAATSVRDALREQARAGHRPAPAPGASPERPRPAHRPRGRPAAARGARGRAQGRRPGG
jgi:exonuclease SbcC